VVLAADHLEKYLERCSAWDTKTLLTEIGNIEIVLAPSFKWWR